MRYLLDTNACVDYLTGRHPKLTQRIVRSSPEDLCTSTVVIAELRYGAERSEHVRRNHERIDVLSRELSCFPFDDDAAHAYGRIRRELETRGEPIGPYDMMIAAHAVSRKLTLVTDNVREFRRVRRLRVTNWRS